MQKARDFGVIKPSTNPGGKITGASIGSMTGAKPSAGGGTT